eukprot:GHVN01023304.1.p1 GENE.GHVN01023304.1~~GHVN01023304.1.p1  ORF type:complete len:229 (-),score=26.42 GHVN01023304.1:212-898(-)
MVISERELVHPFYKQLKPIYFSDLLEELINIQDDAAKRRCLECEKEKFELCPHEVKDIEARLETVGKVLASEDMSSHVTDLLILFEKLKQKIKIKFLTQEFNDQRNQRDLHPTDATPVGHLFADWTALKTTSPNRLFADCNQGDRRCLRNAFRLAQEDCENMIIDMNNSLSNGKAVLSTMSRNVIERLSEEVSELEKRTKATFDLLQLEEHVTLLRSITSLSTTSTHS